MAGIYVHIPFCSSRCIYCDFYSSVRRDWTPYVGALCREIESRKDYLKGVPPATVYFGGGTPSLLPESELESLLRALSSSFDLSRVEEFTLEANPDDVTPAKACFWRSAGVNRVSMGVQSFCDEHLAWMRRRHDAARAVEAFRTLRSAGFDNISIDLIFGFAALDDAQWDSSIDKVLELRPEHVSCYQMMGRHADSDQEKCYAQYSRLQKRLAEAGYRQYEISNWALEGRFSRHNSSYWSREPYAGFGAAAHSFDGVTHRRWNLADIDGYIAGKAGGGETLSPRDVFDEQVMLGLRRISGLDLRLLDGSFADKMKPVLDKLARTGDIVLEGSVIRIPAERLFVSDGIVESLFAD